MSTLRAFVSTFLEQPFKLNSEREARISKREIRERDQCLLAKIYILQIRASQANAYQREIDTVKISSARKYVNYRYQNA